jgi:ABC-2 type transport system ATP-binding protein
LFSDRRSAAKPIAGSTPASRQLAVACASAPAASEAVAALVAAGIEPSDFSMGSPSLDEVFLALTGKGAEA